MKRLFEEIAVSPDQQLSEVLSKPAVSVEELTPFIESVLVPDKVPHGLFDPSWVGGFADPAWLLYKRTVGVHWDKAGTFYGSPAVIAKGGRDYRYALDKDKPFWFTRQNGEVITPGSMVTDGGSIPRVCWAIPGLDPWSFMPAFLIHDWDFMSHHCTPDYGRTFEQVNDTLAEGVYTLMASGIVKQDWRALVAIHTAVSSFVGRKVWDRSWTPEQCWAGMLGSES